MTRIGSDDSTIAQAASVLKQGGLVVFPTETVYGLGGNAYSDQASLNIFSIKNRPPENPMIVHVGSVQQVSLAAAHVSPLELKLFQAFSPGPLTLVLPKHKNISPYATGGLDTVGVRIPKHPIALALLQKSGVPVAAPSANLSGKPSPTTLDMCRFYMEGKVPYILDGGSLPIGIESTVVRVEGSKIYILRSGAISAASIQKAVGIAPELNLSQQHRSPGTRFAHYQPKAKVVLFDAQPPAPPSDEAALMALSDFHGWKHCFAFDSPEDYAQALYRIFFWCDSQGLSTIYCQMPKAEGIGAALIDRLTRAGLYKEIEP